MCYNQRAWVESAVDSVLQQTYPNIELIVADDGSTDGSQETIQKIGVKYPQIQIILSAVNKGNCRAFNEAFRKTRGEFIVDFAADDVMAPERIEKQVKRFGELDDSYGVVFTDADYIDHEGKFIRTHFAYLSARELLKTIPEGDVFRDVLSRYFIAAPTMLVRRKVLDTLGGYDESLAYEDFDFWVRSSRIFKYALVHEPLTQIRRTGQSMREGLYKRGDRMLHSTYMVCLKAAELTRDQEDLAALIKRVRYELRQSVFSDNRTEGKLFYTLLRKLTPVTITDKFLDLLARTRIPMRAFRDTYQFLRWSKR